MLGSIKFNSHIPFIPSDDAKIISYWIRQALQLLINKYFITPVFKKS